MIVENDKKVHLNILTILVGTKCNLKCQHCIQGDVAPSEIDIKYIDSLIDNVSGINMLEIIGGEISLYTDKIKAIFDRFIERKTKINYLVFTTNGAEFSQELVNLFNDFRYNHTTYPLEAEWQFSPDKFHFNNGFTEEKCKKNIEQYTNAIGKCDYISNSLQYGVFIAGRAVNLTQKDLAEYEQILIPCQAKYHLIEFKKECKNIPGHCNNGNCIYNCIAEEIWLTPDGYIYNTIFNAYNSLQKKDNKYALGNIEKDSLYDMIQKHIQKYPTKNTKTAIHFRDYKSYKWISLFLLNRHLKFRDATFIAFKKKDFRLYEIAKNDYCFIINNLLDKISEFMNADENAKALLSWILQNTNEDFKYICDMAENQYFINNSDQTKLWNDIKAHYKSSVFSKNNFSYNFHYNYDLFKDLWKYYDAYDFENYKKVAIQLFEMQNDIDE